MKKAIAATLPIEAYILHVMLWCVCTVGIQLSPLQLPETSSYRTFTSPLTEWSRDKAGHSVNRFFVR